MGIHGHWSVKLEYDYYRFGNGSVSMFNRQHTVLSGSCQRQTKHSDRKSGTEFSCVVGSVESDGSDFPRFGQHRQNAKGRDLSLRCAETGPLNERRLRRIVKVVGLGLPLSSAILAIAFATAARANDVDTAVSKEAVEAKIKYCEVCHGPSAQGFVGYYPIPRLAGQQPAYIKNQLQAFIDRGRVNPIMANVAHVLSPAMQTALANNFHELNPKPFGGVKRTWWPQEKNL